MGSIMKGFILLLLCSTTLFAQSGSWNEHQWDQLFQQLMGGMGVSGTSSGIFANRNLSPLGDTTSICSLHNFASYTTNRFNSDLAVVQTDSVKIAHGRVVYWFQKSKEDTASDWNSIYLYTSKKTEDVLIEEIKDMQESDDPDETERLETYFDAQNRPQMEIYSWFLNNDTPTVEDSSIHLYSSDLLFDTTLYFTVSDTADSGWKKQFEIFQQWQKIQDKNYLVEKVAHYYNLTGSNDGSNNVPSVDTITQTYSYDSNGNCTTYKYNHNEYNYEYNIKGLQTKGFHSYKSNFEHEITISQYKEIYWSEECDTMIATTYGDTLVGTEKFKLDSTVTVYDDKGNIKSEYSNTIGWHWREEVDSLGEVTFKLIPIEGEKRTLYSYSTENLPIQRRYEVMKNGAWTTIRSDQISWINTSVVSNKSINSEKIQLRQTTKSVKFLLPDITPNDLNFRILNALGREIHKENITKKQPLVEWRWADQNISKGVYLYTLENNKVCYSGKIVLK